MTIKDDNDIVRLAVDHFTNLDYKGVVTTAFPMKTRTLSFGELINISGADLLAILLQKQIMRCENPHDKIKLDNLYHALFNDRDLWEIDLSDEKAASKSVDIREYKFICPDAATILGQAYAKAITTLEAYLDGFSIADLSAANTDKIKARLEEADIKNVETHDILNVGNLTFNDDKLRISFWISYTKQFMSTIPSCEGDTKPRAMLSVTPVSISVSVSLIDLIVDGEFGIMGPKKGEASFFLSLSDCVFSNKSDVDEEIIEKNLNVKAISQLISKATEGARELFFQKLYSLSKHSLDVGFDIGQRCLSCHKLGHSDCNPYIFNSSALTQSDIDEYVEKTFSVSKNKLSAEYIYDSRNKFVRESEGDNIINKWITNYSIHFNSETHRGIFGIFATPKYPFLKNSIVHTQVKIAEETELITELVAAAIEADEKEEANANKEAPIEVEDSVSVETEAIPEPETTEPATSEEPTEEATEKENTEENGIQTGN